MSCFGNLCPTHQLFVLISFNTTKFSHSSNNQKSLSYVDKPSHIVSTVPFVISPHIGWPKDKMNNIIILKDCSSTIPGFENVSNELLKDMVDLGVRVETTDSFML